MESGWSGWKVNDVDGRWMKQMVGGWSKWWVNGINGGWMVDGWRSAQRINGIME